MSRWYRNRYGYRKNKSFSRGRGRYGGYSRGYSQAPRRGYQGQRGPDVNVVVGRKRIWIFNNTDDILAVMPGQYVVLEIMYEGDNQLGHFFRATVLGDGRAGAQAQRQEAPEERPQDWV
jgi:uncharacterized protein YneR